MPHIGQRIVRWNAREWERLAQAAAPLIMKGEHPLNAYRYVQELVFQNEPHRKRHLNSAWDLKQGEPVLHDKLTALRLAGGSGGQPLPIPAKPAAPVQPAPAPKPAAQGNGAVPAWMEAQIEKAAQEQAAKIRAQFQEAVAKRVTELLAPPPDDLEKMGARPPAGVERIEVAAPVLTETIQRHKHDPQPDVNRDRNPKVVIVGLWPQLRAEVNNEFGDSLDLRFFDNDKRELAVIERHARSAVLTITMQQIHGEVTNAARRAAQHAGRMWESVHGSKSAMFDRLTKLAVYRK